MKEMGGYVVLGTDKTTRHFGGCVSLKKEDKLATHWVPYILITEQTIEKQEAKCIKHGAKVCVPITAMAGHGRFNVMKDNVGATFSLWEQIPPKPAAATTPEESAKKAMEDAMKPSLPEAVAWHQLLTTDLKKTATFYTKAFGWSEAPAPEPTQKIFSVGEKKSEYSHTIGSDWIDGLTDRLLCVWVGVCTVFCGAIEIPKNATHGSEWVTYFNVKDVDATCKVVTANGGKVSKQPANIPSIGRFAVLEDDQNGKFAIFKEAAKPPPPGSFVWHDLMVRPIPVVHTSDVLTDVCRAHML